MKTKFLFLSLLLCSTFSFSQTVIRVKSGEKIQSIIDNISTPAGSTLILDPGNYEGFTVFKRVNIIGSGYFNGTNATLINEVTFSANSNTNSDNSSIIGCSVNVRISVERNNIIVQKCQLLSNSAGGLGINMANATNCLVSQCFIDGNVYISIGAVNYIFKNNFVLGKIEFQTFNDVTGIGKVTNNSIGMNSTTCKPLDFVNGKVLNVSVSNNILVSPVTCDNRGGTNNFQTSNIGKFNNNIIRLGNYQSTDVSNKFITDMTTLFTNTGTSPDSKYLLSATSPAKGAGEGGTDCGAFGGTEPYIIGGTPLGPIIEDLQVPSTARQNEVIKIKLKAKVQN